MRSKIRTLIYLFLLISSVSRVSVACYPKDGGISQMIEQCGNLIANSIAGGYQAGYGWGICPGYDPEKFCVNCGFTVEPTVYLEVPLSCPEKDPPDSGGPGPGDNGGGCEPSGKGSVIDILRQVVKESVPIVGTSFTLNYSSDKVAGRTANHVLLIQLTPGDATYVSHMLSVDLTIQVAGRTINQNFVSPTLGQTYTFTWDGLDNSSNPVFGAVDAVITIDKTLDSSLPAEPPLVRHTLMSKYGNVDYGLGGWMLSVHHFYDPTSKIVYEGTGYSYFREPIPTSGGGFMTVSSDSSEVYEFDSSGKHIYTRYGIKSGVKLTFAYSGDTLTSVTDAFSNQTVINHSSGQPTSIVGPYGQTTTLGVDGNGFLDEITNPNSEQYQMTYYTGGLLQTFEKPNGVISTMTYDANGALLSDSSSEGSSLTLTDTPGISLDAFNYRVINATTAEGISTDYELKFDQYITTIDESRPGFATRETVTKRRPDGKLFETYEKLPSGAAVTKSFAYDPRSLNSNQYANSTSIGITGLYTRNETESRSVNLSTPGDIFSIVSFTNTHSVNSKSTTVQYVESTSKYTTTSHVGRKTYLEIDSYERPTSFQRATYAPVTFSYDGNGRVDTVTQDTRVTTYAYNVDGYLDSVVNALTQTTSYLYDSAGRVTSITLPDTRVIAYGYDSVGNVNSVTTPSNETHDFTFNGYDLISQYLSLSPTNYVYDDDRRITQITRPNSDTIVYAYGATSGRLETITIPTGTITITPNGSWDYDDVVESPDGVIETLTHRGGLLTRMVATGSTTGRIDLDYDDFHRMLSLAIDNGTPQYYTYDNDGVQWAAGSESISLESATGKVQQTTLDNAVTDFTYSSTFGELESITSEYSSNNVYKATYTRDDLGRIISKVEKVGAGSNQTYEYFYDSTGRLTSVDLNSSTIANYTYDDNGNRTQAAYVGGTVNATFNAADQLTTHGTKNYSYNVNGELETVTDTSSMPSGVTSYTWDALGNLKSVTLASSTVYDYLYDGYNRRVGKKVGGTLAQQFIWLDQLRIAAEYDGTGTLVSEFVYGNKPNVPDYLIKGSDKYKIITDHLGSVVAVIHSTTGAVAQVIAYDEFGRVLSDTSPGFQPFGFAGGLYDSDTGLVRFGARSYDAETGRWLSKDPILFAGGDTNLYGYVLEDPVNLTDSSGQFPDSRCVLMFVISGASTGGTIGIIGGGTVSGGTLALPSWAAGLIVGTIAGGGVGLFSCPPEPPPPPPPPPPGGGGGWGGNGGNGGNGGGNQCQA